MQVNGIVTVAMEESKVSRGVIDGWISETWCLSVDARLKRWRVVSLSVPPGINARTNSCLKQGGGMKPNGLAVLITPWSRSKMSTVG